MDRFQSMQTHARVVDVHSFSRTAESLSLPASRFTRAIQGLQAFLGVRLLQRSTRHISLTPEGVLHDAHCRKVLEDLAKHHAVGYRSSRTARTLAWHFVVSGELRSGRLQERLVVNDATGRLARRFIGVSVNLRFDLHTCEPTP